MIRIALLLTILSVSLSAQTITGSVTGTVVDSSGATIPGALVTLTSESTGVSRELTATDSGAFVFAAVPPGRYALRVEKAAFRTSVRTGLVLTANDRLSLGDIALDVGQTADSVTVSAQTTVLQTESADTTAMLTTRQLDKMVIRGRDVINLLRVLPGVSQGSFSTIGGGEVSESDNRSGSTALGNAFGSGLPYISGLRSSQNSVNIDGQSGNDAGITGAFNGATSVDAIAEVKVVTNPFQAEYGRNSGSQVNIVTKSGTRDFHGSLYWFKRHEQFNANDFFNNRQGLPKPISRYDTLGGTLGGPVVIPGRFNRDRNKLFFFYSREDWRIKQPTGLRQITVPTQLERRGDFSQSLDTNNRLIVIRDPSTGQAFPGNVIPQGRINPSLQALLNLFPWPNANDRSRTLGAYNYEWQTAQEVPKAQNLLKLDYNPTSVDTLTVRGRQWRSDVQGYAANASFINTNWPMVQHHYLFTESSVNVAWTRVLRPTLVNEVNTGMRGLTERGTLNDLTDLSLIDRTKAGVNLRQFNPQINPYNVVPQATFGGLPSPVNIAIDGRFPIEAGDNRFTFSDNLSWIRGSHSFKFGGFFERNWASEGRRANQFGGSFDFARDANNPFDTNHPFSNALLGYFRSYIEQSNFAIAKAKNFLAEWFAQDTWKATRRFTLNYGVRFSSFTPWTLREPGAMLVLDRYRRSDVPRFYVPARNAANARIGRDPVSGATVPAALIGAFVPNSGNPANGMVLANSADYAPAFLDNSGLQAAPRVGFALDLFGNGRTALRGGFGVSKQAMITNQNFIGQPPQSPPVQFAPQIFYGNVSTLLDAAGYLFPSPVTAAERNPKTPTVYNYSFGVQQKIGALTLLDVSYVGNQARHLLQVRNLNQLPYGWRFRPENADPTNPASPLPDNLIRPYPGFANINYIENSGYSNYNGLHVGLTRSMANDIQFGVAYTWSKAMGLTDNDGDGLPAFRPYRIWNYGKLGYDQTHKLVANFIYEVPRIATLIKMPALRHVTDNWQMSGIATMASGLPQSIALTTTDGADIAGGGDGVRVVMLANPNLPRGERSLDRWFNTEAFGRPVRGDFGNAPRDVFRGPGIHNYDLSLYKRFPIRGERTWLQFRTEFYNLFNHTQGQFVDNTARFDPQGRQTNGRFGQVIATRLPRSIQFAVNFYF